MRHVSERRPQWRGYGVFWGVMWTVILGSRVSSSHTLARQQAADILRE